MKTYRIWRRGIGDRLQSDWIMTTYNVKGRTDKEAESRMKRKFANCGFHSMSLVAVESGVNPNAK